MPIHESLLSPRLACLGYIKIGQLVPIQGKEGRYRPEKLDHFLLTTMIRDEAGYKTNMPLTRKALEMQRRRIVNNLERQLHMEISIREDLAGRPMSDKQRAELTKEVRSRYNDALRDERLRSLDVMLPFEEVDQNLTTTLAVYDGQGCRCRGDGDPATPAEWINPKTGEVVPAACCPCNMLRPENKPHPYLKPDPRRGQICKPHAQLRCMITAAKTLGGVHVLRTTSWNTISQLLGAMAQVRQITGGPLAYIPLLLTVRPKTTVVTRADGSQSYQRIYIVDLTYQKEMLEFLKDVARLAQQRAQMRAQIQTREIDMLPPPGHEPPEEQRLIGAEFSPNEADGEEVIDAEAEPVERPPSQEPQKAPQSTDSQGASEGSGNGSAPQEAPAAAQDEPPPPTDADAPPADQPDEPAASDDGYPAVDPTSPDEEADTDASKEERTTFISIGRAAGYNDEQLRQWMSLLFGVESTGALKSWQIRRMTDAVERQLQQRAQKGAS